MKPSLLLLAACALQPDAATADYKMPLTVLTDAQGRDKGARCLDGTNPGFYHRAAPSFSSLEPGSPNTHKNDWVVYFKGGGWCYDEESCLSRSKTDLGSSSKFPSEFGFSGVMDPDPTVNPDFSDFNHVIFYYCDGASFSGNVSDPVTVHGTELYFRGRVNLEALLDTMDAAPYNLADADNLLVAGGSAGGLSTYLHSDYIAERYAKARVRAAPVSGFFLMHNDYHQANATYTERMKYVFHMQNSEGGVNQNCVKAMQPENETWRCIFANYSYAHSTTPMFVLNSAVDAWQMGNVWDHNLPCFKEDFKGCTAQDIEDLNGYAADFLTDLKRSDKFSRDGEGGFIDPCYEHCGMQGAAGFDGYTNNNVTAQQALGAWWNAKSKEPSKDHFYLPCQLHTTTPHQCNPSCDTKAAREQAVGAGYWMDGPLY